MAGLAPGRALAAEEPFPFHQDVAALRLRAPALRDVEEDEDDARQDAAAAEDFGAPLSSIGRSAPSAAMSTVLLAKSTTVLQPKHARDALHDLTRILVDDPEDLVAAPLARIGRAPPGQGAPRPGVWANATRLSARS